jgi:hypothetical protein
MQAPHAWKRKRKPSSDTKEERGVTFENGLSFNLNKIGKSDALLRSMFIMEE